MAELQGGMSGESLGGRSHEGEAPPEEVTMSVRRV